MFDTYSFNLFNHLPNLPELDIEQSRRLLAKAYMYSIRMRLGLVQDDFQSIDLNTLSEAELDQIEEEVASDSFSLFNELYYELRRLGDSLESSAIFDNLNDDNSIKASSFVAAESLSLLATLLTREEDSQKLEENIFSNEFIYTRIEASLLFLIAGYDANARTEINEILKMMDKLNVQNESEDLAKIERWCFNNLISILSGKLWDLKKERPLLVIKARRRSLKNLVKENKYTMFSIIGDSIISYIDWLTGENEEGLSNSLENLYKINTSTYQSKYALYPEIFHLSKIIIAMIEETSKRSLFHHTPPPTMHSEEFTEYLKYRVRGNRLIGSRPFIWESSKEFISECLPGPSKHSIVNLPTGSGKSFIAELAVAQSLLRGWVLYLAPTNALVHQIKRDLKVSLSSFDIDIRTFVGGDEYTTLQNEFIDEHDKSRRFVAVMTPEKCAMSLRINPKIFEECSLCVFDECHLLGEGTRGVTADLVLGQILSMNSDIKFVLMSAMLNNASELADWLENVTKNKAEISSIFWKPTRSIRGAVGVEYYSYMKEKRNAKIALKQRNENRKNEAFEPKLSLLYSLSGVWNANYDDYSRIEFPFKAKFKLSREKYGDEWIYSDGPKSWVNETSKVLGYKLALSGMPTIVFIPANRHYPFTLAKGLNLSIEQFDLNNLVMNFLFLAEEELGVSSEVKNLLEARIGVHTSFMLEAEKEAVERSFMNGEIKLLFATGTLAQGLNLPSVAVVIAGTRIGDSRDAHTPEAKLRSKALILNAIGRAGRAGFSNQSLSILVPNEPIMFKEEKEEIDNIVEKVDVLGDRDASIEVSSPIEDFLDNIINGSLQADRASLDELAIISMLTSDNEIEETEKTNNILSKTYGASSLDQLNAEKLTKATIEITKIKKEFLKEAGAPEWVITVARKSGFDFFTTNTFVEIVLKVLSVLKREEIVQWTIKEWKNLLFLCLKELPPYYINRLLPNNITKKDNFLNKMLKSVQGNEEREITWEKPVHWNSYWEAFSNVTWLYMEGKTYAEMAKYYLRIDGEVESSRSSGKPIPTVLALIKRQIEGVSSYAGLLVATLEETIFKEETLPFNLNALPLAIKNGLQDHSSLYWYTYTFRNRIVAHTLSAVFPLDEFVDEETSKRNVLTLKREWLNDRVSISGVSDDKRKILEAAKLISKNA